MLGEPQAEWNDSHLTLVLNWLLYSRYPKIIFQASKLKQRNFCLLLLMVHYLWSYHRSYWVKQACQSEYRGLCISKSLALAKAGVCVACLILDAYIAWHQGSGLRTVALQCWCALGHEAALTWHLFSVILAWIKLLTLWRFSRNTKLMRKW